MLAETLVIISLPFLQRNNLPFIIFKTGTKQSVILETEKDQPCLCPERPKPAAEQKEEITKTLIISIIGEKKRFVMSQLCESCLISLPC